jgi:hypothetical protein
MTLPESERSDWTEQDLLTLAEARPRLEQAIAEVASELELSSDPIARATIEQRLEAMRAAHSSLIGMTRPGS